MLEKQLGLSKKSIRKKVIHWEKSYYFKIGERNKANKEKCGAKRI